MLSTSTKLSVRIHLFLIGHPNLAINSDPNYDPGFSKMVNKTVYSVSPKYSYVPMGTGGNTENSFVIHKFWIFKVAMPIADAMY